MAGGVPGWVGLCRMAALEEIQVRGRREQRGQDLRIKRPINGSTGLNSPEASGGRYGTVWPDRIESGRWQVANKGTYAGW